MEWRESGEWRLESGDWRVERKGVQRWRGRGEEREWRGEGVESGEEGEEVDMKWRRVENLNGMHSGVGGV